MNSDEQLIYTIIKNCNKNQNETILFNGDTYCSTNYISNKYRLTTGDYVGDFKLRIIIHFLISTKKIARYKGISNKNYFKVIK